MQAHHHNPLAPIINGELSFGEPIDFRGGNANGVKDNMRGSWVTATIEAVNAALTFNHNLNLSIIGCTTVKPNVVWVITCIRHSGTGTGALALEFQQGDAIGANSIQLRLRNIGRTVAAGADAVTATVFFQGVPPW